MAAPVNTAPLSNTPADTNVVDADQLNEKFDRLYDYLTAGVDTFAAGSVNAAALASEAVTADKLAPSVASAIGMSQTSKKRRGKCVIATEESRTNTAFGTLTTPDLVEDLVLESDGLIFIAYRALWKQSATGNAAKAALFLGENQVKIAREGLGNVTQAATPDNTSAGTTYYGHLQSFPGGLMSNFLDQVLAAPDTAGQIHGISGNAGAVMLGATNVNDVVHSAGFGGICVLEAAAGTYDVSVRFAATSGSVTVKERKLRVWSESF